MSHEPTGGSKTISGAEKDTSCCIIEMEKYPLKHLKDSAGHEDCCIFRVPHTLFEANETAYKPKILSIGPYHHLDGTKDAQGGRDGEGGKDGRKNHLEMIQEHKQRYLEIFLSKIKGKKVYLTDLCQEVRGLEKKIRDSYSEDLNFDSDKLVDMMVLDGCFILTLFLVISDKDWRKDYPYDPIFKFRWILPTLRSDLLLLENQVPLFLLQALLSKSELFSSSLDIKTKLNSIIFNFFRYSIVKSDKFWKERKDLPAMHLLDLIRKTFIPKSPKKKQSWTNIFNVSTFLNRLSPSKSKAQADTSTPPQSTPPQQPSETQQPTEKKQQPKPRPHLKLVVSAIKLQLRGIKFEPKESETPLDITLKNGVLKIPLLTFDDFFSSLLINCVAFEQFSLSFSTEMTSYVTFMGCLINTAEDATFLIEKGIIENYFGTGDKVSLFFKNIGNDIAFSISRCYLSNEFEGINKYTAQRYRVQILCAGIKYTYFNLCRSCFIKAHFTVSYGILCLRLSGNRTVNTSTLSKKSYYSIIYNVINRMNVIVIN
ncbi:hypothetical protein CARUB_v10003845mg [Capsella rubella]|uniref:Uncharacterized protein n=1 Tax=Capsella rubella TaxID=81985 RepID=R0HDF5_9BRAS|nr:UPF0481 protein At3g47200 [Capsella rubella]EOA23065.1 hypothetical protein CARUB_v10003845mg [Capsella rubella]